MAIALVTPEVEVTVVENHVLNIPPIATVNAISRIVAINADMPFILGQPPAAHRAVASATHRYSR